MYLFKSKITITHYDSGTKYINFTKHQKGKCWWKIKIEKKCKM